MKAIVNTGPGRLELREYPMPAPGPGQVRIRTGACGICATDLEMIAGWDRTGFPAIPGHEWAGTVDAVGPGVNAKLTGRRCVAENVLTDGGEVGFEHPGGYAEYLITEANKVRVLPDDFPFTVATLIEPLAVCVRGLRRLRFAAGESALVFGDGPIGLLMILLLARNSAQCIGAVGGRNARLDLASEFGVNRTLNYHAVHGDLAGAVRTEMAGPFQAIIEATGSPKALDAALQVVAPAGRILVLGDYREACASFPWNHLLHREMEIIGSNASAGAWPEAVRLATREAIRLQRLISHRLPVAQFEKGISFLRSKGKDVIKVVLEY